MKKSKPTIILIAAGTGGDLVIMFSLINELKAKYNIKIIAPENYMAMAESQGVKELFVSLPINVQKVNNEIQHLFTFNPLKATLAGLRVLSDDLFIKFFQIVSTELSNHDPANTMIIVNFLAEIFLANPIMEWSKGHNNIMRFNANVFYDENVAVSHFSLFDSTNWPKSLRVFQHKVIKFLVSKIMQAQPNKVWKKFFKKQPQKIDKTLFNMYALDPLFIKTDDEQKSAGIGYTPLHIKTIDKEIENKVNSPGDPWVFITMSSMSPDPKLLANLITETVNENLGVRFLISGGWGGIDKSILKDNDRIYYVDYISGIDTLLKNPNIIGGIVSGGAGFLHILTASGKPAGYVLHVGDQFKFMNALERFLAEMGIKNYTIPNINWNKLSSKWLVDTIRNFQKSEVQEIHRKLSEYSLKNGPQNAARKVEEIMEKYLSAV